MKRRLSKYVLMLEMVQQDLFCKGIQLLATVAGLGANSTHICYTVTPLNGQQGCFRHSQGRIITSDLAGSLQLIRVTTTMGPHDTELTHRKTCFNTEAMQAYCSHEIVSSSFLKCQLLRPKSLTVPGLATRPWARAPTKTDDQSTWNSVLRR